MRLPLATSLKTRTGAPEGKDARLKNCYVETRGDQSIVRKRAIAQGGISIASVGTISQGGIEIIINNQQYIINIFGDVIKPYGPAGGSTPYQTSGSTSNWGQWDSGTSYNTGDSATQGGTTYYATSPNVNQNPTSAGSPWSPDPVDPPAATHIYAQVTGTGLWFGSTPFYCPFPGGCLITYYLYRNITVSEAALLGVPAAPFSGMTWDGCATAYSGYGNLPNPPNGFWHF